MSIAVLALVGAPRSGAVTATVGAVQLAIDQLCLRVSVRKIGAWASGIATSWTVASATVVAAVLDMDAGNVALAVVLDPNVADQAI